jgi:hypothetical protein
MRARRGAGAPPSDRVAPAGLVEFAGRNGIAPMVAHALLDAGTAGDAAAELRAIHDESERRVRTLMDELDRVAAAMAALRIPLVALKNAGIARGLHPCAGCCPMGDVDVLVPRPAWHRAHRVMLACGYALDSRSRVVPARIEDGFAEGGSEYLRRVGGQDVWFELQWRAVAGRFVRRDQEPDGEALVARSVPIDGSDARLLCPVDNMLQVALHTAKHSYARAPGLRLHTDVDRLVAHQPPDWGQVVAEARRLGARTAVYFSLALARHLLGTPVPAPVLDALRPARWRERAVHAWLDRVDVFEPGARKFSRLGLLAFHSLLYDDARGWLAAAADMRRDEIELRRWARIIGRGGRRTADLLVRWQP